MTELVHAPSLTLLAELEKVGGIANSKGLTLPPDLPFGKYLAIGAMLNHADRMLNWYVADYLLYGEHTYGEKFAQASALFDKAPQTLLNIQSAGRQVPPQRRRADTVDFWHHYEVRTLPAAEQKRILKQAEDERLTKMQVRDLVREAKGEEIPAQEVVRDICSQCGRPL